MLANECDLNVAALYHYFPSKAALFQSVIEEQNYQQRFEALPPFDESDDDRSRLVALLCEILTGALGEEPVWRLILGESVRGNELAISQARDLIELFDVGLGSWVRQHLPHGGEPDAIAQLLLGQILMTVLTWLLRTSDDEPDILETAQSIANAVLSDRASQRP